MQVSKTQEEYCVWTGETGVELEPVRLKADFYLSLKSGRSRQRTRVGYVQPKYKKELSLYLARASATQSIKEWCLLVAIIFNWVIDPLEDYTNITRSQANLLLGIGMTLMISPYIIYPQTSRSPFERLGFRTASIIARVLAATLLGCFYLLIFY